MQASHASSVPVWNGRREDGNDARGGSISPYSRSPSARIVGLYAYRPSGA